MKFFHLRKYQTVEKRRVKSPDMGGQIRIDDSIAYSAVRM